MKMRVQLVGVVLWTISLVAELRVCHYLPGFPMGTSKPMIEHFLNIIEIIGRRLSRISSVLY
jgi:hypothetical protein